MEAPAEMDTVSNPEPPLEDVAIPTTLPTLVNDGTTVQLTDYTGCTAGNDLRLYTVDNGGHAWPNGLTQSVGKTTQNLDATGIIWSFASAYHL